MRVAFLLVLAALLIDGCGGAAHSQYPGAMQRLDSFAPQLALVTTASADTTRESYQLRAAMLRARPFATVTRAHSVMRYALRLKLIASRSGTYMRNLIALARTSVLRRYLTLILDTLRFQWLEAQRLVVLCRLISSDPLILGQRDQGLLRQLSNAAAWFAWHAVLASTAAERWQAAHRSSFRYHPVKSSSPARGG